MLPITFPDRVCVGCWMVGSFVASLQVASGRVSFATASIGLGVYMLVVYGVLHLLVRWGDFRARWHVCRWSVTRGNMADSWQCCACSRAAKSYNVPLIPLERDNCPACGHACCEPGLLARMRDAWRPRRGATHDRFGEVLQPADFRRSAELARLAGLHHEALDLMAVAAELEQRRQPRRHGVHP